MPNETRVNLKHLLEDIRDSYASPLEEIILTELIANALDGKAANIRFVIDSDQQILRCIDDGCGMRRPALREYHNIAASAKQRGLGIGFAGVGAKLSLLMAQVVSTESKGGHGSKCATEWHLSGPYRAPWKFVPYSGLINGPRGTAVSIQFANAESGLLNPAFVRECIIRHFYPLLNERIHREVLRYFYKKPPLFFINNERVTVPEAEHDELQRWFSVGLGKARRPIGVGFLAKTDIQVSWLEQMLGTKIVATSLPAGLCVSTFGKIIKGGWEWLGVSPKNSGTLSGVVEIPALSEILTTNKNDFLSDSASLKKYYKFRKAVQEAIIPVLESMGEVNDRSRVSPEALTKPLSRLIAGALNGLLGDFPELEGLISSGRASQSGKISTASGSSDVSPGYGSDNLPEREIELPRKAELEKDQHTQPPPGVADPSKKRQVRAPKSGLKIALSEISDAPDLFLGRIIDDVLTVNTLHPAWRKAKERGMEEYHILIATASVLSEFLEPDKSPQKFLNRLLAAWAQSEEMRSAGKLF